MAQIEAVWEKFRFDGKDAEKWANIRAKLDLIENRFSRKSVYVIRTTKPFAIAYPKKASPVMYIGEGHFDTRFRNHLRNWIAPLVTSLPTLSIEVYITEIRVRGNSRAYRDVEADLLHRFGNRYGSVPLMNQQFEYHDRNHRYSKGFFGPIYPESGSGYKWAISPLISNLAYPASLKGRVK